jgi:DNA-binding CsgD family transcriptional regulator
MFVGQSTVPGGAVAGLSHADLKAVLEFVRKVESVPDLPSFQAELVAGLARLIPCDVAHLGQIDGESGRALAIDNPSGSIGREAARGLVRNFEQHPTSTRQLRGDPRALKISDFLGVRRFTRTALYNECHRLIGTRHELRVRVPAHPPNASWLVVHRTRRDFSERDREVLALISPHFEPARRNAELRQLQLTRERFEGRAPGVALLSPTGTVLAVSGTAERLAAAYDGRLPAGMRGWLRRQGRSRDAGHPVAPAEPLRLDGGLVAHFLPGRDESEPDAVIFEESLSALTDREAEVLELVAAGSTDKEIAHELGISLRTVQKHLERVYRKLGVPNRTAAVARIGRIRPR